MLGRARTFGFGLGFGEHFFDPRRVGCSVGWRRRCAAAILRSRTRRRLAVSSSSDHSSAAIVSVPAYSVSGDSGSSSGSVLGLRFGRRLLGEHDLFVSAGSRAVLRFVRSDENVRDIRGGRVELERFLFVPRGQRVDQARRQVRVQARVRARAPAQVPAPSRRRSRAQVLSSVQAARFRAGDAWRCRQRCRRAHLRAARSMR